MASSWLAWLVGHTLRPVGSLVPANAAGITVARSAARLALPVLAPAPGARVRRVRTRWEDRPVIGDWVRAGTAGAPAAILYLHGSGYMACSPRTHRGLVAQLSRHSGMPAFVPRYRLAPEHRFPAAADDALAAYRWLLAQRRQGERIVVAGDSAGGHLALGLCLACRRAGLPLPAALALFSPLADPTWEIAAARDEQDHDPFFSAALARRMLALCAGERATDDPRFAPLRADLAGLPPVLVQAGGSESLAGDAEAIAEAITRAGGDCRLEIWPGQVHVFQILYRLVPEAREALHRAAAFLSTEYSRGG